MLPPLPFFLPDLFRELPSVGDEAPLAGASDSSRSFLFPRPNAAYLKFKPRGSATQRTYKLPITGSYANLIPTGAGLSSAGAVGRQLRTSIPRSPLRNRLPRTTAVEVVTAYTRRGRMASGWNTTMPGRSVAQLHGRRRCGWWGRWGA